MVFVCVNMISLSSQDGRVFIHPSSVNSEKSFPSNWFVYYEKVGVAHGSTGRAHTLPPPLWHHGNHNDKQSRKRFVKYFQEVVSAANRWGGRLLLGGVVMGVA